jgi:hypothetical protein
MNAPKEVREGVMALSPMEAAQDALIRSETSTIIYHRDDLSVVAFLISAAFVVPAGEVYVWFKVS